MKSTLIFLSFLSFVGLASAEVVVIAWIGPTLTHRMRNRCKEEQKYLLTGA